MAANDTGRPASALLSRVQQMLREPLATLEAAIGTNPAEVLPLLRATQGYLAATKKALEVAINEAEGWAEWCMWINHKHQQRERSLRAALEPFKALVPRHETPCEDCAGRGTYEGDDGEDVPPCSWCDGRGYFVWWWRGDEDNEPCTECHKETMLCQWNEDEWLCLRCVLDRHQGSCGCALWPVLPGTSSDTPAAETARLEAVQKAYAARTFRATRIVRLHVGTQHLVRLVDTEGHPWFVAAGIAATPQGAVADLERRWAEMVETGTIPQPPEHRRDS